MIHFCSQTQVFRNVTSDSCHLRLNGIHNTYGGASALKNNLPSWYQNLDSPKVPKVQKGLIYHDIHFHSSRNFGFDFFDKGFNQKIWTLRKASVRTLLFFILAKLNWLSEFSESAIKMTFPIIELMYSALCNYIFSSSNESLYRKFRLKRRQFD